MINQCMSGYLPPKNIREIDMLPIVQTLEKTVRSRLRCGEHFHGEKEANIGRKARSRRRLFAFLSAEGTDCPQFAPDCLPAAKDAAENTVDPEERNQDAVPCKERRIVFKPFHVGKQTVPKVTEFVFLRSGRACGFHL